MPNTDVAPEPKPRITDDDIMTGGPMTPPAPADTPPDKPPTPPSTVKVKLGGKEYEVAPELHEAIESYRRDLNERDGKRGSELESLRRTLADLQDMVKKSAEPKPDPTPTAKGPRPPDAALMLTDPERFLAEFTSYLDAREQLRQQELTQRYQTAEEERSAKEENRKAWDKAVNEFYKDNPDLVGEEDLVDIVWRGNYNDLKTLPLKEGFKRIAQLTRERITRLASKGRTSHSEPPPVELEAGRPKSPPAPTMRDAAPAGTLSDLIRNRQRKMRGG